MEFSLILVPAVRDDQPEPFDNLIEQIELAAGFEPSPLALAGGLSRSGIFVEILAHFHEKNNFGSFPGVKMGYYDV